MTTTTGGEAPYQEPSQSDHCGCAVGLIASTAGVVLEDLLRQPTALRTLQTVYGAIKTTSSTWSRVLVLLECGGKQCTLD